MVEGKDVCGMLLYLTPWTCDKTGLAARDASQMRSSPTWAPMDAKLSLCSRVPP